MATAVGAMVHGSSTSRGRALIPYLVGTSGGGAVFGAILGLSGSLVSSLLPAASPLAVILLVVSGLAVAMLPEHYRWPQMRRQIPRWWTTPPSWYGLLLSGIVLGIGVFNFIRHSIFHLYAISLFALGILIGPTEAIAVGTAYGVSLGIAAAWQEGTSDRINSENRLADELSGVPGRMLSLSLAVAASTFLVISS